MTRWLLGGAAALALCSTLVAAQDSPEDLLPPGFEEPEASPTPRPSASGTTPGSQPSDGPGAVVQPLPDGSGGGGGGSTSLPPLAADAFDLSALPSLEKLEAMSVDELDEFLGLKPKVDIPPGAQRSLERVGVLDPAEGGLPVFSLQTQPAALVRAALAGTQGPLVSRWGHILARRALASRLAAPLGMDPVEFAALRANVLNRLGEHAVARAMVQDVDTGNYSPSLANVAVDSYVGSFDIVGACPAVRIVRTERDDSTWKLLGGICAAFAGEETRAKADLRRALYYGEGERIDILLAQRFAGAAGQGRNAVTIEWQEAKGMSPWRFALATALGEQIPEELMTGFSPYYWRALAQAPAVPPAQRVRGAEIAGASGVLSSGAMVDLYAQIFAEQDESAAGTTAARLRDAYVSPNPADRLAAIKDIWTGPEGAAGDGSRDAYGRLVLTAYAAARIEPADDFEDDAPQLIAAMLAAGLERDALLWDSVVADGSEGWALLALARPGNGAVASGDVGDFVDAHDAAGERKAHMLVAGLAGLGRIEPGTAAGFASDLGFDLNAQTRWTRMIDRAAQVDNRALVVFLAALGMQGESWERMTPRHLYHIVAALNRVGLGAEARMIAAEAVARA